MAIDPDNLPGTATLTFADEFNSLSLWNGSAGTWATSFWYAPPNGTTMTDNGDKQWYINSTYGPTSSVKPWTVSSGVLSLTAAKADPAIGPYINNYEYTSGTINSYYSFSQTYGYFEMSAQLPKGQGLWPAFWLLPTNGSWPPEIDIMEVLGDDPTVIIPAMHSMATGFRVATGHAIKVADLSVGFHTFGLNWAADYITWYVDGAEIMKARTPADLHSPMYMIANLAVGGYWSGPVDSTTPFPSSFKIDYIRVYQDLGVAQPPPPTGGLTGTASVDTLRGTSRDDAINGLAGSDKLYGGAGRDSINGGPGNDSIFGGPGSDTLTGDVGRDNFVFDDALGGGVDQITDFSAVADTIRIDRDVFTALLSTRSIPSAAFYKGSAAHDASDRIIYDPETGAISYDSDGDGPAAPVQFADVAAGLNITAKDFYVV